MNFLKAVAVPNQASGAYYSGKLQLIVALPHGIVAGDWVQVTGSVYNGIFRVTDYFDNQAAKIAALYFGDIYFQGNDTGTLEKLDYNPIAAKTVEAPAVYAPGVQTDAEFKAMIWDKMGQIENNDPALLKMIAESYPPSPFGYTQLLAHNAIKILKEAGIMPMNQFGAGIWGQGDWVQSNYPKDTYVVYSTAAPTTLQPGYVSTSVPEPIIKSAVIPLVPPVNPNPGAPIIITPLTTNTNTMTDSQYIALINTKMALIKANTVMLNSMLDSYSGYLKNVNPDGRLGYTQFLAAFAITLLMKTGEINKVLGNDWVKANYPMDAATPVIPTVNPNPGATPTPTGNPANNDVTPPTTVNVPVITIPVVTPPVVKGSIPAEVSGTLLKNPLVQIVLAALGILLLISVSKKTCYSLIIN